MLSPENLHQFHGDCDRVWPPLDLRTLTNAVGLLQEKTEDRQLAKVTQRNTECVAYQFAQR